MADLTGVALTVLVLGASSSLQPCAFAVNISAVSFLLGWARTGRRAFRVGLAIVAGIVVADASVAAAIVGFGLALPVVATTLHEVVPLLVGPVLIMVGMVHAGLYSQLGLTIGSPSVGGWLRQASPGLSSGFLFGVVLALTLCPVSAAAFFGVLIPLAVSHHSAVLLPVVYGFGASLPVLAVAVALGSGFDLVGRLASAPAWLRFLRPAAGWLLIVVGVAWTVQKVYL